MEKTLFFGRIIVFWIFLLFLAITIIVAFIPYFVCSSLDKQKNFNGFDFS
ncbi:MAG: hypothetical protein NDI62_02190 [Burkholderiales bacterium]|nr:hypothetical protein [Burkholderiales bacterium]